MGGYRLTAIAATTAAFLVAPAALLADEPTTKSAGSFSATGNSVYAGKSAEQAAVPSAGPSVTSVTLRTSTTEDTEGTREKVPRATSSAATSVTIGDYFYRPQDVSVSAGDPVTWTNDGKVPEGHTVTGDGFDSGVLEEGDTYTHSFSETGSFDYVCTLHPNMRGTVTVTAAASGGEEEGGGTAGEDSGSGTGGVPSTSAPSSASGDDESSGSLASTGLNLVLLGEIAACFIATGLLIRRLLHLWPGNS